MCLSKKHISASTEARNNIISQSTGYKTLLRCEESRLKASARSHKGEWLSGQLNSNQISLRQSGCRIACLKGRLASKLDHSAQFWKGEMEQIAGLTGSRFGKFPSFGSAVFSVYKLLLRHISWILYLCDWVGKFGKAHDDHMCPVFWNLEDRITFVPAKVCMSQVVYTFTFRTILIRTTDDVSCGYELSEQSKDRANVWNVFDWMYICGKTSYRHLSHSLLLHAQEKRLTTSHPMWTCKLWFRFCWGLVPNLDSFWQDRKCFGLISPCRHSSKSSSDLIMHA